MALDKRFDQFISRLKLQASKAVDGLTNRAAPKNEDLSTKDDPAPNPHNGASIKKYFDLPSAQKTYIEAITKGGESSQIKNVISSKLQTDIVASIERDYRSAKTSRIRQIALEASRRSRHSDKNGPIQVNYRAAAQQPLKATEESSE